MLRCFYRNFTVSLRAILGWKSWIIIFLIGQLLDFFDCHFRTLVRALRRYDSARIEDRGPRGFGRCHRVSAVRTRARCAAEMDERHLSALLTTLNCNGSKAVVDTIINQHYHKRRAASSSRVTGIAVYQHPWRPKASATFQVSCGHYGVFWLGCGESITVVPGYGPALAPLAPAPHENSYELVLQWKGLAVCD